ncbi:MAG: Xaa-Pro dipeptidyl-peptidase, partial [Chitinophagaceae bacterium]
MKIKAFGFSFLFLATLVSAVAQEKAKPVFKDGEAQIVPAFETPEKWLRHDLWVETSFDTDGDGKLDRVHVSVTRPFQTETEGLKLPVIYETSPYYAGTAGTAPGTFWDVKHEVGVQPPVARRHPTVKRTGTRPTSRSKS